MLVYSADYRAIATPVACVEGPMKRGCAVSPAKDSRISVVITARYCGHSILPTPACQSCIVKPTRIRTAKFCDQMTWKCDHNFHQYAVKYWYVEGCQTNIHGYGKVDRDQLPRTMHACMQCDLDVVGQ